MADILGHESIRIDHVIIGTRHLDPAREQLWSRYGFGITDGAPNGDGSDSWLVPFDTPLVQYLELVVASDERELMTTDYGRVLLERTAGGPAFLAWAVLVDDIEGAAARVEELSGVDPRLAHGESVRADGEKVPWSEAAFAQAWALPSRPFFLRYGNWSARRARLARDLADAAHRVCPTGFADLTVATARDDLPAWLGGTVPGVRIVPAAHDCVTAVTITTTHAPVQMRWGPAGDEPDPAPMAQPARLER